MLANRFYIGDIVYHGDVIARGQHKPIVGLRCSRERSGAQVVACAVEARYWRGGLLELDRRTHDSPPAGDGLTDVRKLWLLMTAEERRSLVLETVVLDMDSREVVGVKAHEDFEPLFRCAAGAGTGS